MEKKTLKKMYYNYCDLEEYDSNMWKVLDGEKRVDFLTKAVEFTGNAELYGKFMMEVLDKWPNSANQNLSDIAINRQAWIGHAACALAFNCPEDIVRLAWHQLSDTQRISANIMADKAIREWERRYWERESNRQRKLF